MTDQDKRPALYSVREAMRRAGVPNWQMGGGVSSADAIDFIAQQRDIWKLATFVFIGADIAVLAAWLILWIVLTN